MPVASAKHSLLFINPKTVHAEFPELASGLEGFSQELNELNDEALDLVEDYDEALSDLSYLLGGEVVFDEALSEGFRTLRDVRPSSATYSLETYALDAFGMVGLVKAAAILTPIIQEGTEALCATLHIEEILVRADRREEGVASEMIRNLTEEVGARLARAVSESNCSQDEDPLLVVLRLNVNPGLGLMGKLIKQLMSQALVDYYDFELIATPAGLILEHSDEEFTAIHAP